MAPNRFDVLISNYDYGQTIDNKVVEEFTGIERDNVNFSFAQMKLKFYLEEELDKQGMPCTICVRDGELLILTHEQAAEYNRKRFNLHMFGMFKSHYNNLKVISKEISNQDERKNHRRTLEVQGKILQAIAHTHESLKLEVARRKTPKMISIFQKKVEKPLD